MSTPPPTAPPRPRLRRYTATGEVYGVCAGLGVRLGIDPALLRIAFVVAATTGGLGFLLYGLAVIFVPRAPGQPEVPPDRDWRKLLGLVLLATAGLTLLGRLGVWWGEAMTWPVLLAGTGLAVLYGPGSPASGGLRDRLRGGVREGLRGSRLDRLRGRRDDEDEVPGEGTGRALIGGLLVLAAGLAFLQATGRLAATGRALGGILVVLVVLALVLGPWVVRLLRTLTAERRERIRSQERAEMAAHLHDSVLQTLTLIQRRADDPATVSTLARKQERELRGWLTGERQDAPADTVAAALRTAAESIEDQFAVTIDLVTVGDRPLDDRLVAVIAAAREAMLNAARFAGDEPISVFLDVTPKDVEVFVRDRGPGFDLDTVPADRHGVRESIIGRMARHGGEATVQPGPGVGTEIALRMGCPA